MRTRLTVVALLLTFGARAAFSQCAPELWNAKNGPFREYGGRYENGAYGFSTVIPKRLIGLDVKNPLYQRGFAIPLRQALLTVSAAPNSLEYASARAAAEGSLAMYRQHQRNIASAEFVSLIMGGKPAETVRVRFTCPPSSTEYLFLETVSVANDYVYTIAWQGLASAFDRISEQTLTGLTGSWIFRQVQ